MTHPAKRLFYLSILIWIVFGVLAGRSEAGTQTAFLEPTTAAAPDSLITLNPAVTYQTMSGWEVVAWAGQESPAFPNYSDQLFDLAVNEAGINRVRLEVRSGAEYDSDNWTAYQTGAIDYPTWRSLRYATVNDNADPQVINGSGFHFSELDDVVEKIVLPLKQRIEVNGERLHINLNYVAFTGQIGAGLDYLHDDPQEYAEFVLAVYQHLDTQYGFVPDTWEVLLEPDNVAQWDGTLLGQAIAAAAARLQAQGYTPRFVAPSNTNMGNAITYFDDLIQVPGALSHLVEFAYHRYGSVSAANLQAIADRGVLYNLDTAMLEWWTSSNGYQVLHEDLKTGRNSAWEQGAVGGPSDPATSSTLYAVDDSDPDHPTLQITEMTRYTRQYFAFIRPGAVRIGAQSDDGVLDPLAFVHPDGRNVVVVKAAAGASFSVQGLPAGTYGIKYTTGAAYDIDLLDITLNTGETLDTNIPAAGVITVYARTPEQHLYLPLVVKAPSGARKDNQSN